MRILCIPYSHTFSHLSRPLAVALELKRRGHEVHFAGMSKKLEHAKAAGFATHSLYEIDPLQLFGRIQKRELRFVTNDDLGRMVDSDIALVESLQPDVVLTDGRFSAGISMQLSSVKHVAIVNVSSCEYRALPYVPIFEWLQKYFVKKLHTRCDVLDCINLHLEQFIFDTAMGEFSRLSRKYNLKKKITATNCLTGAGLTLLPDIPEFFPVRDLPRDYMFIGPIGWEMPQITPSWWPPSRRPGPLIYLTMGTTGIPDFFEKMMLMFEKAGMNAIITTGGQVLGLASQSDYIHVEEFISGDLVMQSCEAVVCHGGNGTIYQSFKHGKPLIGIPSIPDQVYNMRRVESLGAGVMVTPDEYLREPSVLLDKLEQVIRNPSYKTSAARLGAAFPAKQAACSCADILENLCNDDGSGHSV